ncbi:MAG: hypothetical protein JWN92_2964 [Candidatus Acidoferrum typicum]|nr:hypothetical protein [Candidatus Acidoferrum typicum]
MVFHSLPRPIIPICMDHSFSAAFTLRSFTTVNSIRSHVSDSCEQRTRDESVSGRASL